MTWQLCTCSSMNEFKSVYSAAADYFRDGKKVDIQIREHQENRRNAQNALQFHWFKEMEMQGDMTADEYRKKCKLHFGVPIAREDEQFRLVYDKAIKHLEYKDKIACMGEPFSLPVTSRFSVKDMTRYLDAVQQWATGEGYYLTTNEDLYWQAMGVKR